MTVLLCVAGGGAGLTAASLHSSKVATAGGASRTKAAKLADSSTPASHVDQAADEIRSAIVAVKDISSSFFLELCKKKAQTVSITNPAHPSIALCNTCDAPLVGKEGVEKYGQVFCCVDCLDSYGGAAQKRAEYLTKYNHGGFRALTYADYGWNGRYKSKR